jgi:hypothetical protein
MISHFFNINIYINLLNKDKQLKGNNPLGDLKNLNYLLFLNYEFMVKLQKY